MKKSSFLENRSKIILPALLPIFFIFMHFEVGKVFGFHLTLGTIFGLIIVLSLASFRLSKIDVVALICVNVLLLISPMVNAKLFGQFDFLTTGLLIETSILFVLFGLHGLRRNYSADVLKRGVLISFWTVCAFSVLQLFLSTFANFSLYNPWGSNQYLYQYRALPGATGLIRSSGFYLEPSFDAFVICSLTIIGLILGAKSGVFLGTSLMAVLSTQSATGVIIWLLIAIVSVASNNSKNKVFFVATILFALYFSYSFLFERIDSISLQGTSGNYRVAAPLAILSDLLSNQFFGYPMGSLYNVVASYQLFQFGAEQSVSLDNGIYVLIFYFGWLGLVSIFVISVWALFAKSSTVGQSIIGDRQVRIWVLLSLLFSGAIFAPEFSIVTFLVLACWKAGRKHESVA